MALETVILSRIQFAFTISFHILFPSFSIGLATFLAIMEGIWLKTKNPVYLQICQFWTKVFALTFGMGIVSGIVMEFQFGTNWSGFAHKVGDVLGALFTYEVMTAFFIEAGFLGVMLFGWQRVGKKLHYFSTLLVTIGTTLSAFWILSANSWMQTPAGIKNVAGRLMVDDWWHVILNPSVLPRFFHMLLAAYITTAFVIAGISAYYLLKNRHHEFAKACFSFITIALVILTPAQLLMGDQVGTEVHRNQPIKTAAMEGVWNTQKGAPFLVFAIPDQDQQKNKLAIKIPYLASLLNTHELNGELVGLKTVPRQDQPPVPVVFFSFRIMVLLGVLMFALAIVGLVLRIKKTLWNTKWYLRIMRSVAPIGFIALWFGWITAEIGRQPWVVYQMLRTDNAVSPVPFTHVIISLMVIFLVYGVIFGFFYFRYFWRMIYSGPKAILVGALDQPFPYMTGGLPESETKKTTSPSKPSTGATSSSSSTGQATEESTDDESGKEAPK